MRVCMCKGRGVGVGMAMGVCCGVWCGVVRYNAGCWVCFAGWHSAASSDLRAFRKLVRAQISKDCTGGRDMGDNALGGTGGLRDRWVFLTTRGPTLAPPVHFVQSTSKEALGPSGGVVLSITSEVQCKKTHNTGVRG